MRHVVPLREPAIALELRHSQRQRFAVAGDDDRPVMRLAERDRAALDAGIGLHANRVRPDRGLTQAGAVPILQRIHEHLGVQIRLIRRVVRAHPTERFVMPDVRKGKAEARIAGEIPAALFAVDVPLVDLAGTKERQMGIDEEHRMARRALRRADHPTVRAEVFTTREILG